MSDQAQLFGVAPEGLERFHEILSEALPEWKPSRETWDLVLMYREQGKLDLDEQALKISVWFKEKKKRKGSNSFVINWLKRSVTFAKEQNGKRAAQTYWQQRDGGSYLEPLTGDDLKRRGNSI